MKKLFLLLLVFISPFVYSQVTTSPSPVLADQSAVLTFNKTGTPLASYTGTIYAHIGVTVNGTTWQNVKGAWGNNTTQPSLTYVSGTNYTLNILPDLYQYFGVATTNSITQICVVFRSADGSQQSSDMFIPVGAFQYTLTAPALNSYTFLSSGSNLTISANNTNGSAVYNLLANGNSINTQTTSSYSYTHNNITSNQVYQLNITQGTTTFTANFTVVINPGTVTQTLPTGLEDGINYNPSDATKATLVLNAPFKDFVYVAGSFNNWQPTSTYAMKKDSSTGKFWLELTGLTPGQVYTYQYWVCDQTNRPANSPALVKTADPFSTLVLSPFDDPEIQTLGVYPNLPIYPTGQEREVTVLQTGQTPYTWSAATLNFVKPKKKDLVIYEVLIRDFDANRTYQDLINKIDYFKNLKINAIQLMPVMEFEGNMSWGYNTVFHMAPDKRYGPSSKLKEFIDLCHQNGIAVILDVALNHVFGRSPLVRMWMQDANGDGWGDSVATTTENPYINQTATHAYGVGSDLNHFRESGPGLNMTNTYVMRTIKHWIQEYKIDGFRWDLTKGFTNQCTSGDETCTNGYRSDRVAKLKWYADKQWELDPNFLVIFEHLGVGGSAAEEIEWANYLKSGDIKGIMQWRKGTDGYANLIKGNYADVSSITDTTERMIGYAESHDEERVIYKAITESGQTQGNLTKALQRLPAMGALHLLVPGPKMIWHFGDLGWDSSLWTCNAGNVSFTNPDCKLDTKPQPQWANNWLSDSNRSNVYNTWAKLINLKKTEDVFELGQHAWNFSQTGHPRLDIYTSTSPQTTLSYVFVLTNFTDSVYNATAGFPYTGTWVNLMDNSTVNVTNTNMNIAIEAGGFRVFGNQSSTLNTDFFATQNIALIPNPASDYFTLNMPTNKVQIISVAGQLIKEFDSKEENSNYTISDLAKGIYLVKIINNQNQEKTVKLIKK
ncbi:alpha-amylase family glycosyl hydrolase [Flavobacterium croceum]|uniref:alpha-amylase family glycosyl hydrolase n=1 Tax=Flavobacterium croceum TaxID=370975 RepID=UPI0024A9A10A|nr:alpha-amylase family glycosyl hydrolase [Flavobacterium croceum]